MLKAILFDLDDTLIDWSGRSQEWVEYERHHLRHVYDYVTDQIYPLASPEKFFDAVLLLTMREWNEAKSTFRAPHLGQVLVEACITLGVPQDHLEADYLLDAYDWKPFPGVVAFPDALEVLPYLRENGLRLGLVTNAYQPIRLRERELVEFGLMDYLTECRISAADIGYLKPHPAIFEAALNRVGATPDEAIFVGDSPEADIVGAQQAGMRGVWRTPRHHVPGQINGTIVPDGEIATLHDLFPLLDEWFPGWRKD
ncbi:MAG: HAD family hydrolase [Chloroflexi bacterium]|nr:HAD family hydrolase [Chloroflexota bacterium]